MSGRRHCRSHFEDILEPERYELHASPSYRFDLGRRDFFKVMGGGVVVALAFKSGFAQESGGPARRRGNYVPEDLGAWLHIGQDGTVTVFTGKTEIGQNIRTSLAQVVAEELRTPMDSIKMVMADTDLTPYDEGTFGSRTTPTMSPQLRRVAATARELLLDLAAQQWKVDRAALSSADGKIRNAAANREITFGELTKGQKLVKIIAGDVPLEPPKDWRIAGHTIPKVDGRAMVTGKHQFTPDLHLPGMLYGKVLRPSAWSATLASVDTDEAKSIAGATVVHDGDFVGVAAESEAVASRALAVIKAKWNSSPQPSGAEIFEYLKKNPSIERESFGRPAPARGSIDKGLAEADHKIERTYTVAYIAHAPLEPRAAVAEWNNGKLTVWTGTQRPFGVRGELAEAFRIPEERVRVIVPDTGAAYGGKHTGDAAMEAARLSKAAGKPVKLVWTREEEFTWAYFRPAGVIDVTSGVQKDGTVTAWEFHNYNSGTAGIQTLYEIPNQKIEFHAARSPLRQGSYRALAATANHFARETQMAEMAVAVGMDPLAFRMHNLKDARLRGALEAVAESFGWGKKAKPSDGGFGIACGFEKGGYIATAVEVSIDRATGKVRIVRALSAFDCGTVVNPDQLKHQVEGAMMMGIGGALFEAVEFENGKNLNPRFSRYRVPRFSDIPLIDCVLIDRKDQPSAGAGETPMVGLAPAVGNAIFDATGVRLRSLPLAPNGIKL